MAAFEPALIHLQPSAHEPLSPARLDQLARDSGLAIRNTTLHPGGTNATDASINKPRARFPKIRILLSPPTPPNRHPPLIANRRPNLPISWSEGLTV